MANPPQVIIEAIEMTSSLYSQEGQLLAIQLSTVITNNTSKVYNQLRRLAMVTYTATQLETVVTLCGRCDGIWDRKETGLL